MDTEVTCNRCGRAAPGAIVVYVRDGDGQVQRLARYGRRCAQRMAQAVAEADGGVAVDRDGRAILR